MKKCNKCLIDKPLGSYHRDKDKKDGLCTLCKCCKKKYKELNIIKITAYKKIYDKAYREENLDKLTQYRAEWGVNNVDRLKAYRLANRERAAKDIKIWTEANRGSVNSRNAKRRAAKLNASPSWVTKEEQDVIKELYKQAQEQGMHVDHIVPLQGKTVCGLHVLANLQLLSPTDNLSKSNKF